MKKHKKGHRTELNQHDKKILDKYTGFYTNFIESNTADSTIKGTEKDENRS